MAVFPSFVREDSWRENLGVGAHSFTPFVTVLLRFMDGARKAIPMG